MMETDPMKTLLKASVMLCVAALVTAAGVAQAADMTAAPVEPGASHDYPTSVRVEYVQECINLNGGAFALIYQCSCALDRLAEKYNLDDFIESATFVKYAALGGERGGEFRDPDHARELTRKFRSEQSQAYKACNVQSPVRTR